MDSGQFAALEDGAIVRSIRHHIIIGAAQEVHSLEARITQRGCASMTSLAGTTLEFKSVGADIEVNGRKLVRPSLQRRRYEIHRVDGLLDRELEQPRLV